LDESSLLRNAAAKSSQSQPKLETKIAATALGRRVLKPAKNEQTSFLLSVGLIAMRRLPIFAAPKTDLQPYRLEKTTRERFFPLCGAPVRYPG
jgi:hypothetical protein